MPTPKRTPKPSRRPHSAQHRAETIARALIDAEVIGDKRAAERHGVHYRTIENWRSAEVFSGSDVQREMDRLRRELRGQWLDSARDARRDLVERVRELAMRSRSLRATTDALRRVHEVVLSTEIVSEPDAEPDGADQPADPGEAEGEGGEA